MRPSGAICMAVGLLRPEASSVSKNPAGRFAAGAGEAQKRNPAVRSGMNVFIEEWPLGRPSWRAARGKILQARIPLSKENAGLHLRDPAASHIIT
jgi:hypothetical protein